jgi:alanine dehydrogenase
MVRILRDDELRDLIDIPRVVSRIEDGYRADNEGGVGHFPRTRTDSHGTTLAWMGAAIPSAGLVAFRAYLYRSDGYDRGHQLVALYGHEDMELRALFIGRLVGNLRTGAAIAAALRLIDPDLREVGFVGTGYQARNALACIAAVFRTLRVVAWSPTPEHRTAFQGWARTSLKVDVDLAASTEDVLARTSNVVLVTTSGSPVITESMLREPKLLLSINSYRWPEIDTPILDETRFVWTDSVIQASGPGTLFELEDRRSKLRPLMSGVEDGGLRNEHSTRIVINTGAAWEEVVTAEFLYEQAIERKAGAEISLPLETAASTIF